MNEFARNAPRLIATIWFAIAGSIIPIWFTIVGKPATPESITLFLALPILAAAVAGMLRGWRILDPVTINSGGRAFMRGSSTALLAFIIFATGLAIAIGADEFSKGGGFEMFISGVFKGALVSFGVGGLYFALPVVIIGGIAGWLLYRFFAQRVAVVGENH